MLEEIIVTVDDRPGALAEIGELLGSSGVNIETLTAAAHDGTGFIHLVVDDEGDVAEILKSNGFEVQEARPVLVATLDDRPGELGRYCRRLHDAGVDISALYIARRGGGETELIVAVDDLSSAQAL